MLGMGKQKDILILQPRPSPAEHIPYEKTVTITEHRAPTDESVRIFEEMRDAAHKSVISEVSVNDNTVNMKAVVFHYPQEFCNYLQYSVSMNGCELSGKIKLERDPPEHDVISIVYKKLSERIAEHMMATFPSKTLRV